MKKLMVVLMVLSMATLANADLNLSISGPDTLSLGATGTYTVGYTCTGLANNNLVASDVDIAVDFGTIGGCVIITTNRDMELDWIGTNFFTGNYEVVIVNDEVCTDLGSPLFSFTLTAPNAVGVAYISLIENSFFDTDWNQITGSDLTLGTKVVNIPEPMTLGLLGFGGLFLRRRK